MTDNKIIKALECCINDDLGKHDDCRKCPLQRKKVNGEDINCPEYIRAAAFDLINRQKAEIERLEQIIKDSHSICEDCKEKYAEEFEDAKSEARKEFAERLKAEKFTHKNFGELVYVEDVDNLLKEMESD